MLETYAPENRISGIYAGIRHVKRDDKIDEFINDNADRTNIII